MCLENLINAITIEKSKKQTINPLKRQADPNRVDADTPMTGC
jgi:hypothetical protein